MLPCWERGNIITYADACNCRWLSKLINHAEIIQCIIGHLWGDSMTPQTSYLLLLRVWATMRTRLREMRLSCMWSGNWWIEPMIQWTRSRAWTTLLYHSFFGKFMLLGSQCFFLVFEFTRVPWAIDTVISHMPALDCLYWYKNQCMSISHIPRYWQSDRLIDIWLYSTDVCVIIGISNGLLPIIVYDVSYALSFSSAAWLLLSTWNEMDICQYSVQSGLSDQSHQQLDTTTIILLQRITSISNYLGFCLFCVGVMTHVRSRSIRGTSLDHQIGRAWCRERV